MLIRVYRKDRFISEPERYCITGQAPLVKVGCDRITEFNQTVGSVTIPATKGSFDPKCGEIKVYPKVDRTIICCG